MVRTKATTVEEYLGELDPDRRDAMAAVRKVILANLPDGYEEAMGSAGIAYQVPLERFTNTYNKQPLAYAGLASQKNYMSLYLMNVYAEDDAAQFRKRVEQAGKRLDMGKACIRFKKTDDLALDVIGETIASMGPDEFIGHYMATRPQATRR
jgi:Domain of unknown function (DU1801)